MQNENSIEVHAIITHAGGIFFFDTPQERESYVNWLAAQSKEQWNISRIINKVHEDSPHYDKACTWLFRLETARASLYE